MQLHEIKPKTKKTTSRRIGRGGKRGKTSGKGGKGQTARAGGRPRPEMRDIIKRLPKLRGFGKNRARTVNNERVRSQVVSLERIENVFQDGEAVNPVTLIAKGLLSKTKGRIPSVKILAAKNMKKKLIFSLCTVSLSSRKMIEKAGGSVL